MNAKNKASSEDPIEAGKQKAAVEAEADRIAELLGLDENQRENLFSDMIMKTILKAHGIDGDLGASLLKQLHAVGNIPFAEKKAEKAAFDEEATEELRNLLGSMFQLSSVPAADVEALLDRGADPNTMTEFNTYVLLEIMDNGPNDAVGAVLVRRGADYTYIEDEMKDSVIASAVTNNCRLTIAEIAKKDINVTDHTDHTMLGYAIQKARTKLAIQLVSAGADVFRIHPRLKTTELQRAFECARKDLIVFLLSSECPSQVRLIIGYFMFRMFIVFLWHRILFSLDSNSLPSICISSRSQPTSLNTVAI